MSVDTTFSYLLVYIFDCINRRCVDRPMSHTLPLLHHQDEEQHRAVHEGDDEQYRRIQREGDAIDTQGLNNRYLLSKFDHNDLEQDGRTLRTSSPASAHWPCATSELG